jgi:hypothetical protein
VSIEVVLEAPFRGAIEVGVRWLVVLVNLGRL